MEIAGLPVACEIDEIVFVDVNAMLACGPEAAILLAAFRVEKTGIARTTPGMHQDYPPDRIRVRKARACSNR